MWGERRILELPRQRVEKKAEERLELLENQKKGISWKKGRKYSVKKEILNVSGFWFGMEGVCEALLHPNK